MSNPPTSPYGLSSGAPPRPPAAGFFDSLRRTGLVRTQERWLGGVAGGLARRLGVDPILVRCALIVLCVFTGLGLLLYGLGWAFLPEEADGRIHAQQALTGDLVAGLAGSVLAMIAGLSVADSGLIPSWWVGAWNGSLGDAVAAVLWSALVLGCVYGAIRAATRGRERRRAGRAGWVPSQVGAPGTAPAGSGASGATPWQPADRPQATGQPTVATTPSPVAAQTYAATTGGQPTWPPVPSGRPGQPQDPRGEAAPPAWAVQPAAPRRPRRPRRPGPGRTTSLLVLGLTLLALAGCGTAAAAGALGPVGAVLLIAGVLVAGLGLGVLVSGVRGRRGGWMSWLAWPVVLILGLPALTIGSCMPPASINAPVVTDPVTIRPTAQQLEEAAQTTGSRTVNLGTYAVGDVTLDLRNLDEVAATTTLRVTVGMGEIRVLTAEGQSVEVRAGHGLGGVSGTLGPGWATRGVSTDSDVYYSSVYLTYDADGHDVPWTYVWPSSVYHSTATLTSPQARSSAGPDLVVEPSVGVGGVNVTESQRHDTWDGVKYEDYWVVGSWTDARGATHGGDELPVTGMSHRAVSTDVLTTCIEEVLPDSMTADGTYVDVTDLDLLTTDERQKVDACVDGAITAGGGTTATAVPSPAPSASAEPTSSATAH